MYLRQKNRILVFLVSLFFPIVINAAGASLYLSPNAGSFYVGETFNISIFLNTGKSNVNAVEINLKFDPTKIQVVSPVADKSFIEVWIAQPVYSNTKGTISFMGGLPSPGINSSAAMVSTITFRAVSPGESKIFISETSRVLLDDGKGTNILTSTARGVYTLLIPPPEGPRIFSSTHSDQNKWYKNNNPTFSWEKEPGIEDFSYTLDQDPKGVPDNIPETSGTSVSFSDLNDGIWYFHLKGKKEDIWGGSSHYILKIDTTAPASFTPEALPSAKTSTSQPIVSFFTTDVLSGLDHFELKYINLTVDLKEEASFFIETISPFRLPSLKQGRYLVVVRAFDKAGNWRDESIKIEITPQGFQFTKHGVWFFGMFFRWWLFVLILIIILAIITAIFVYYHRKRNQEHINYKEQVQEKEKILKEHIVKVEKDIPYE